MRCKMGNFVHFSMFPCCTAGGKHFKEDLEMMVGSRKYIFWLWWKACWYFFSPIIIVVSAALHQVGDLVFFLNLNTIIS